jgi:hypothetical protein
MTHGNGLSAARPRTCPCGTTFSAKAPEAKYCSRACKQTFSRYGRTYGQTAPRELGVFRPGGAR